MPCCIPDLLYAIPLSLAREYNSDLGVDHWRAVKIVLSGIRICFSIMEKVRRKGLRRCKFDTNLDDSKSRSRYILKVGAIS